MNKAKAVWLIGAAVLIVAGIFMCAAAIFVTDFRFEELSTQRFAIVSHDVIEDFENIEIYAVECDVRFARSSTDACRVTSVDSEGIYTDVKVEDGTLKLIRRDVRRWYESIGIWFGSDYNIEIVLYLPRSAYDRLNIVSASGNIDLSDDFSFGHLTVQSSSGDVRVENCVIDGASIKTTSGSIDVKGVIELGKCVMGEECMVRLESTSGNIAAENISPGELTAIAVSGDVYLEEVNSETLTVKTTSGDIELRNVFVRAAMQLSAVSGDVEFYRVDADTLNIKTTSGDVEGTLVFAKSFVTDTVSGSVRIPESDASAGDCTVSTTSGDIDITIAK